MLHLVGCTLEMLLDMLDTNRQHRVPKFMLCHFLTCLLDGCAEVSPQLMLHRMCSVSVFRTEDKRRGRKLCGSNHGYVFRQTNGTEYWEG